MSLNAWANEPVKVGREVLSYCGRCKMDLAHTVVAMTGDRIARVECRTCRAPHGYRAPKGASQPRTKTARKVRAKPEVRSIAVEWELAMKEAQNKAEKPYDFDGEYADGDCLSHPTYGRGVVLKLIHPNKIEVIFQSDVKVLIYGGPKS